MESPVIMAGMSDRVARFGLNGTVFTFALLFYAALNVWVLYHGHVSDESLFRWAKVITLLEAERLRIEYLGFVYPHLSIYALIPFYLLAPLRSAAAPYLLNALLAGAMIAVYHGSTRRAAKGLFPGYQVLLIALNPFMWWAFASGSPVNALSFVLFYFMCIGIIHLIGTVSTRNIFIVSILLAVYFFVDERSMLIAIAFGIIIPFVLRDNVFRRHPLIVYLLLFTPFLLSFFSWAYINWLFFDNPWHFLASSGSAFLGAWQDSAFIDWLRDFGGRWLVVFIAGVVLAGAASPLPLITLVQRDADSITRRAALLSISLPAVLLAVGTGNRFFASPLDALFLAGAAALAYSCHALRHRVHSQATTFAAMAVGIAGAWMVLSWYPTAETERWLTALRGGHLPVKHDDKQALGLWLDRHRAPTLLDDRLAFPAIVARGDTQDLILPYSDAFKLAQRTTDGLPAQIAVPDPDWDKGYVDELNRRYPHWYGQGPAGYRLVYDHRHWRVWARP